MYKPTYEVIIEGLGDYGKTFLNFEDKEKAVQEADKYVKKGFHVIIIDNAWHCVIYVDRLLHTA
jgi:hypothetical protein